MWVVHNIIILYTIERKKKQPISHVSASNTIIIYDKFYFFLYRGFGMSGGLRARVVDETLGESRAYDAVGLGIEG